MSAIATMVKEAAAKSAGTLVRRQRMDMAIVAAAAVVIADQQNARRRKDASSQHGQCPIVDEAHRIIHTDAEDIE